MPKKITQPPPKQGYIEGMEPPSVPEIDRAVEAYVEARGNRTAWLKKETDCKDLLLEVMKRHGLSVYKSDLMDVRLVPGELTVKVQRKE